MNKDPKNSLLVKQVEFVIVVRRIKVLGIAITLGIVIIYLAGLFVADSYFIKDFETVNLLSLIQIFLLIPISFYIRKILLKSTNVTNFSTKYFNAHIIPFMIVDFSALLCITTNLFVNGNILYASIGAIFSAVSMIMLYPKEEDFDEIKKDFME